MNICYGKCISWNCKAVLCSLSQANFKVLFLSKFRNISKSALCSRRWSWDKDRHRKVFRDTRPDTPSDLIQFQSSKNFKDNIERLELRPLCSSASGTGRSLLVSSNNERLLFNCGDGIVRMCKTIQHTMPIYNVFITSNSYENFSGVYDLHTSLLGDLSYISASELNIYCPTGLKLISQNFLNKLYPEEKMKLRMKRFPITFHELEEQGVLNPTAGFSINYIPIYPSVEVSSSSETSSKYVLAYVYHAKYNLEKLMSIDKLLRCDVPAGPLVYQLMAGESVTLENGKIVHTDDVVNIIGDTGRTFIVLDIPSKDYLDSLISCKDFELYQTLSACEERVPEVIIHFSPDEVLHDERFLMWVNSFPASVSHMIINSKSGGTDIPRSNSLQKTLSYLLPSVFPLPWICTESVEKHRDNVSDCYGFIGPTLLSHSGHAFHMRPEIQYELALGECHEFCADLDQRMDCKRKLELIASQEEKSVKSPKMYPVIWFLGTASSTSSTFKDESSILVDINEDTCILLDCGSGTLIQIYKLFGPTGAEAVLRKLKLIFISHHHKDHFQGINSVIAEREKLNFAPGKIVPKLYVMVVPVVAEYIDVLRKFQTLSNNLEILDNGIFFYKKTTANYRVTDISVALGMKIETTYVPHCHKSFGVAFTHKDGWKLVYSGDTIRSNNLIKIGKDCDILIHEATFDESLTEDARIKRHSTVADAISVGRQMNARNVILTHFSLRYPIIPSFRKDLPSNVCVAFDFMKVTRADIPLLSKAYSVLKELFIDEDDLYELEEEEEKL